MPPTCSICNAPAGPTGTILSSIVTATAAPSISRCFCFNCSNDLLDLLDGCRTAHANGHPDVLGEAADLVADSNSADGPPDDIADGLPEEDDDSADEDLDDPDDSPAFGHGF